MCVIIDLILGNLIIFHKVLLVFGRCQNILLLRISSVMLNLKWIFVINNLSIRHILLHILILTVYAIWITTTISYLVFIDTYVFVTVSWWSLVVIVWNRAPLYILTRLSLVRDENTPIIALHGRKIVIVQRLLKLIYHICHFLRGLSIILWKNYCYLISVLSYIGQVRIIVFIQNIISI